MKGDVLQQAEKELRSVEPARPVQVLLYNTPGPLHPPLSAMPGAPPRFWLPCTSFAPPVCCCTACTPAVR